MPHKVLRVTYDVLCASAVADFSPTCSGPQPYGFHCPSRACAFTKSPTYHPCSSAREWVHSCTTFCVELAAGHFLWGFSDLLVCVGQLWHLSKEGSPEDTMEVRRIMRRLCALYNSSPTLTSAEAVRFFSQMGTTIVRAIDAALPAQPALRVRDWLLRHHRLVCVRREGACSLRWCTGGAAVRLLVLATRNVCTYSGDMKYA
jgi:hypothetical protein